MKRIITVLAIFIIATQLFAVTSPDIDAYSDSFYFRYNPTNTLDRSVIGFTYDDIKADAFKTADISSIKYAVPSSGAMAVVKKTSETGEVSTYATLKVLENESPLNFYAKVNSPNGFTIKLNCSDLAPTESSKNQNRFAVTYDIGPITRQLPNPDHPEGNTDYISKADPDPVTVDSSGPTDIFSVTVGPLDGVGRSYLGYWMFANVDIKATSLSLAERGEWNATMKIVLAIN